MRGVLVSGFSSLSRGGSVRILKGRKTSSFLTRINTPTFPVSTQLYSTTATPSQASSPVTSPPMKLNLMAISPEELSAFLSSHSQPGFRSKQILQWISQGVTSFSDMNNLPLSLRRLLSDHATIGSLTLASESISEKDRTIKRAYRLPDGQLIESVLMRYKDGRNTACISSQAGCAMGCVFCATGQMGFARQLTTDEIFEQVSRYAGRVRADSDGEERLNHVVFMGMGEPLANYRNVMGAVRRIREELGIGSRRITISTVGVVPAIKKLMMEEEQVRLALSLHCATEEERSALLPANTRYGGLEKLMETIKEYTDVTRRRVTFEWALIEHENDREEDARRLGKLLKRHGIRKDFCHVNVIPLNPTGGFGGSPSGKKRVDQFLAVLENDFGISATPRVRRGIDIEAGCGQLATELKRKEKESEPSQETQLVPPIQPVASVEETHSDIPPIQPVASVEETDSDISPDSNVNILDPTAFTIDENVFNLDRDDIEEFQDEVYTSKTEQTEAQRLLSMVQSSFPQATSTTTTTTIAQSKTTSIINDQDMGRAKKRRKKLLKQIKAINTLKEMEGSGKVLNEEQREKVAKELEWKQELESVEHNLQ